MTQNTAVAIIKGKPVTLETLLERSKKEIQKVLPLHIPVDRFVRVAITTVRKSPQLQACNAISIVGCIMESAQLGLEISGVLGHAYMVPYNNEAQLQIGYRGFTALANDSDKIDWCDGKVVYEGDIFDYQLGTDPYIKHTPCGESDFDKVTHAYFITKLMSGSAIFNVWPVEKILAHRDKYSKAYQKKKSDNAWSLAPEPMYIKTVARPTLKFAPISNSLQRAIGLDEQAEAGIPQQLAETISDSIMGTEDEISEEDLTPDIEHNRDGYPEIGKHSENAKGAKADPKIWREVPDSYIEWVLENTKPGGLKDHALAESIARRKKATEPNAEYEDVQQSELRDELLDLLKCPALPEEMVDDIKAFTTEEQEESWYEKQIAIVRGFIADYEKVGAEEDG